MPITNEGELVGGRKKAKVLIVGGGYAYIKMFWDLGFDGASTVEDADIVCFTGGEDVDPSLYGEVAMPRTYFNRHRDEYEMGVYRRALDLGKPMVGICRGGQFLNVMNGGKLFQHVNNHTGQHIAFINDPSKPKEKKRRTIDVTSTHHQMMRPTEDAIILMSALESTEKHCPGLMLEGKDRLSEDTEVCFYAETNSLCFQPHPELGSAKPELVDYFEECVDNWLVPMIPLVKENK